MAALWGLILFGVFAALANASIFHNEQLSLKVSTTTGILHGKFSSVLDRRVKLFLGVPYATSPVGNLRFMPPVELHDPNTIKEATSFAPSCTQPQHMTSVISPLLNVNKAELSEDCLYLNIYIPEVDSSEEDLAVMVWIAGEGFDFADPQQYDGSYLAAEGNVIVVTVNYRLSAFGFLNAKIQEAPGNVGILDQQMALRWVQNNIGKFGGNPEKVTLFGRFTGSMCAAIQAFAPLKDQKLFSRVILQSGVPVLDWVYDSNPVNTTRTLAKSVNCASSEISEAVRCLKSKSPEEILAASLPLRFRPSIDGFVRDSISAAGKSDYSSVDVMLGFNSDEGSLCSLTLDATNSPFSNKLREDSISKEDYSKLIEMFLRDFYKKNSTIVRKLSAYKYNPTATSRRSEFLKFCGDLHMKSPSLKLANVLADKPSPVFVYEFQHRPSFSIHPEFLKAAHGDDILFTLGLALKKNDLPAEEVRLVRKMVQAISNFAKTGAPADSHDWPMYTKENKYIQTFSTDKTVTKGNQLDNDDMVDFWYDVVPYIRDQSQCRSQ